MKHFLRQALLAGGILAAATAAAQSGQMHVHAKDGTVHHFDISNVDSVTFNAAKEASNPLNLKVDKVGQLYALYSTAPEASACPYNIMHLAASDYALYASDDDVVADDVKYYTELAEGYGMTLAEVLEYFLYTEATSEICIPILPDTEYVLWGYGMDSEGKTTTPFYKTTFRTAAVEKKEGKIAITPGTDDSGNLTVTFTPDDDSRAYVSGFLTSDMTAEEAEKAINKSTSSQLYDYYWGEYELDAAIEKISSKGVTTSTLQNATAGKSYYAVAAYVSDGGAIESTVCKLTVGLDTTAASTTAAAKEAPAFIPAKKSSLPLASKPALSRAAKAGR